MLSTSLMSSRNSSWVTALTGASVSRSSMKSPSLESSSLPMGVSSEMGSCATLMISRSFSTVTSISLAISSSLGLRPRSCASLRETFLRRLIVSTMWTGMRMVRA
ncbi:hypothetical protein D3C87_1572030 [compost metagenome]